MSEKGQSLIDCMWAEYKQRYMRPAYKAIREVEDHIPIKEKGDYIYSDTMPDLPVLLALFARLTAPSKHEDPTYLLLDEVLKWLGKWRLPKNIGACIHPRALTAALKLWLLIPPKIVILDEVKDSLRKCKHQTMVEQATVRRKALRRAGKRVLKVRRRWGELGHPTLLESLLSQYGQDAFECVECHPSDAGSYEILPRSKETIGDG